MLKWNESGISLTHLNRYVDLCDKIRVAECFLKYPIEWTIINRVWEG